MNMSILTSLYQTSNGGIMYSILVAHWWISVDTRWKKETSCDFS